MVDLHFGFVPYNDVFGIISKRNILDLAFVLQLRNECVCSNLIKNGLDAIDLENLNELGLFRVYHKISSIS